MPSSPQTVTTRGVFDYLYNSAGKAIVGATVNCTLNFNGGSVTAPIVNLGELQQSTVTDQNGFWRFNLVPNDTITPTGTLYTIQSGNVASYDISVPSGGADVQSSSILANTPSVLSPALTNLTGPITVTGNETVTGNLSVSGTTTLGSTTTGALTTAAETVGGDLTIGSAFRLLFGAAASKIIPGATSISLRDNADANDNLIVTNAGNVTIRGSETITGGGWTLTAGDAVITAGRLLLNAAAAKIKGGATSLSLRNNADSADNVLVSDAGFITLRNALALPPSAAGTVATTGSYGASVSIKISEIIAPGGTTTISFTSIPGGFRTLFIRYIGQTSNASPQNVTLRFNADAGANYFSNSNDTSNVNTPAENLGTNQGTAGSVSSSSVSNPGCGMITIYDYGRTTWRKEYTYHSYRVDSGAAGTTHTQTGGGLWTNTAAITQIDLFPAAGNWIIGSIFELIGEP